jgi:hypothetical protein
LEDPDIFMCGAKDSHDKVHYTRPCAEVVPNPRTGKGYTSVDLEGPEYADICPYYSNCALTTEEEYPGGPMKCKEDDLLFTFIGRVGRVVAKDLTKDPAEFMVTFNDGRTSYLFTEEMLKLESHRSMYEVWWVVRTKSEFIVQKRKGFNVISPLCTFDDINDQYYPWAVLDDGSTKEPTSTPSTSPTSMPSVPTGSPSSKPTSSPTSSMPSSFPTGQPTSAPVSRR